MVFQGRTGELIDTLTSQMEKAAEELNFELAAEIRDRIKALGALNAVKKFLSPTIPFLGTRSRSLATINTAAFNYFKFVRVD